MAIVLNSIHRQVILMHAFEMTVRTDNNAYICDILWRINHISWTHLQPVGENIFTNVFRKNSTFPSMCSCGTWGKNALLNSDTWRKKNIKTMHCCTIYLGPNTHGTRGHLTSCHRGPMAGHAHSSKNAFYKTTRYLKCWIPVRKSEGLAQPGVPLLVMLVEVQPKAQALKRFVVAARQLRK